MKLRTWIQLSRYSIVVVSKIFKVNRTFIYYMMSGKRKPSQELLDRITEATHGQVSTFEDLVDNPTDLSRVDH